jgi:hypothetical protein
MDYISVDPDKRLQLSVVEILEPVSIFSNSTVMSVELFQVSSNGPRQRVEVSGLRNPIKIAFSE